jgi:DNA-directed RNA polymerase beta' subunit
MEDAKVNFDMTVRNASGSIIQFMYGEDSIDPIKLEKHHLDYLKMNVSITDMEDNYLITEMDNMKYILKDKVIQEVYDTKDWEERMRKYFEQVIEDREFIIKKVLNNKCDEVLFHPISVHRMVEKIESMFNLKNMKFTSDLNPLYVLDEIDRLVGDLKINKRMPEIKLVGVIVRHYFSPKKLIFNHRFTKDAFDYMVESFKQRYMESLVHPSDMVGVVAAQSIGEPSTQLTLNSVEYNTEIVVRENGKLKEYRIGEWIESRIANGDKSTHQYIEKGDQIYAPISKEEDIRILTSDENGKVFWDHVDAITRHLPINEDGSNTLIRITTMSGHECVVTKGESVLTRQNNKLLKSKGSDLKIGDYLPAMKTLPIPDELRINELDISEYVSKKEYVYMSEVEKALNVKSECESAGNRHWWTVNKGNKFELPYTRSDGFVDALIGIGDKPGRRMQLDNRSGCVYPKAGIYQSAHIPEKIVLDELFGFVIGAYLAEGCLTKYHVLISNNNDKFMDKIKEWADKYNIKYHYDEGEKQKGYSRTIRMHSLVIADLFGKLFTRNSTDDDKPVCMKEVDEEVIDDILEDIIYELHQESKQSKHTVRSSSRTKHLPVFLLGAPDECLKGLIDAYFSGDGCVSDPSKNRTFINASSVSKSLLENIGLVLRKFGILSSVREQPGSYKNAIKQGYQTTMPYTLFINKHNSIQFAKTFSMITDHKQQRLNQIKQKIYKKDSMTDIVPNVTLSNGQVIDEMSIHSLDLEKYKNTKDYDTMKTIMESNVFYDRVVKLEEVKSKHTHVFDLTTRFSRNFADKCMVWVDTFHLSGVASASKAVRGVPRIKELLSVSKNMKAPSCTIYLNDTVDNYNDAKKARYSIETTYMKSLVTKSDIYYEPNNNISTIEEDQLIIDEYDKFKELDDECMNNIVSPWILRIELDRRKMMDIGLTTMDINLSLKKYYNDNITCMFSDDNYDKVIFRIALTDTGITDIITDLKALEYNIMEKIIIAGIDKIKKVSISQKKQKVLEENTESMFRVFVDKEEYVLESDGTNLMSVLANDYVDSERTISNDITEIYSIFGVEAARQALYNEIDDILNSTTSVNHRHIALLVDTMTCKGYLLSVDRHGINRSDIGPLAKCSFEETSDILIKAGVFGEIDRINGVSANIILGQIANCGTGDS